MIDIVFTVKVDKSDFPDMESKEAFFDVVFQLEGIAKALFRFIGDVEMDTVDTGGIARL